MDPERALLGGAAVVAAIAVVAVLALPGAIASPGEEIRRPGPVQVAEMAVEPGDVSGGSAELALRAQVDHGGNPTPNVTVRFRAVDAESGFVAAERTVDLGTVREDGWRAVNATLAVPREGGYDLEATVFRDREPVDTARKRVRGVEALTPGYARTAVEFTERGSLPTVAVSVVEAGEDRTTLRVASRLTNEGDEASDDLRLVVVMRQAESNLVADEVATTVGAIRPGRTEQVEATVEVPAGYNYYVDVALYRDGVLLGDAAGVANLDPERRISANDTVQDVEFNVSDFERERPPDRPGTAATETSTPGFGPAVAVVALLAVVLLARLRR